MYCMQEWQQTNYVLLCSSHQPCGVLQIIIPTVIVNLTLAPTMPTVNSSLQVMYDGTKSYDSTFSDTGSQSVSGQTVMLSGLTPRTDYSVVVTAINTAGFRRSSDPVVGTTLTGKLRSPLHLSTFHSPPLNFSLPPSLPSPPLHNSYIPTFLPSIIYILATTYPMTQSHPIKVAVDIAVPSLLR